MRKIGTWNVRSMFQSGKAHNIIKEMKRLDIDLLGISEMRWPRTGSCIVDDHTIYYSGNDDTNHFNGVGFIVNKKISRATKNFVPISDRVCLLQLSTTPVLFNFVAVYAPTCDSPDEVVERFYQDISDALKLTKPANITIVMGDFNAKVGNTQYEEVVGSYGLGTANDRGQRLIQFCQENELVLTNTHFQQHPRRLYTWTSNADRNVKNQIDYIAVNRRYRNIIKSVKTYPGADVFTDHCLLLAKTKITLKKVKSTNKQAILDMRKLQNPEVSGRVRHEICARLESVAEFPHEENINSAWEEMKTILKDVGEAHLKSTKTKHKAWMNDEILHLMDLRRNLKQQPEKYREAHRLVQTKIREAKEDHLKKQCEEIEVLQNKHDSFNMYKKIKQTAGIHITKNCNLLVDERDRMLTSTEEKLSEWTRYVRDLFNDDRTPEHSITSSDGYDITKEELENALSNAKNGKAPGPDDIHVEVIKH